MDNVLAECGGVESVNMGQLPNRDARVTTTWCDWLPKQWGDLDILGLFTCLFIIISGFLSLVVFALVWWLICIHGSGLALAPS